MKRFKQIDCGVQGLLIAGSFFAYFVLGSKGFADGFIVYFLVGGWQLLSSVIHLVRREYNKKTLRIIYWLLLAAAVAGAFIADSYNDGLLTYMIAMLFVTPALAVYYCIICMVETKAIDGQSQPAVPG